LIDSGNVLAGGRRVRRGDELDSTAAISLAEPRSTTAFERPDRLPRIVWEGGDVIGVNKPAGYHSHRGKRHPSIADFLAERYPGIGAVGDSTVECGLIHRLDRDTSGIMIAAAERRVFRALRIAFGQGQVSKDYLALVHGVLRSATTVEAPLVRLRSRVRAARRGERALAAVTRVSPMQHGGGWTLVLATMTTGVTHQIRAHLSLLGHPVIGDRKYGDRENIRDAIGGQRLHACCIRLPGDLTLAAAPDERFLETLAQLRAGKAFA
jgi:23S rRNA pseudouridine1911/1915/1917 synthase